MSEQFYHGERLSWAAFPALAPLDCRDGICSIGSRPTFAEFERVSDFALAGRYLAAEAEIWWRLLDRHGSAQSLPTGELRAWALCQLDGGYR